MVLDAPPDDLEGEAGAGREVVAEERRIHVGAQGVDVVHHQEAQLGSLGQELARTPLLRRLGTSYQWPTGWRHWSGTLSV